MKRASYIIMVLVALVMAPELSNVVTAQAPALDRELCLQNCSTLRPWINDYGGLAYHINCLAGCDSQFWGEVDRNTERQEKKLHEPD